MRADEIPILLNELDEAGRLLRVRYPLYDIELFTYDPKRTEVLSSATLSALDDAHARALPRDSRLAGDLPTTADLRDALLAAGAARYANAPEATSQLAKELASAQHANNPNPTFLAFDTNVLYDRLPRRGLADLIGPQGLAGFRYAVSEGVISELDAGLSSKYTEQDLWALKNSIRDASPLRGFLGRPYKRGRRAKAAVGDVTWLVKQHRARRLPSAATGADKEANDRVIAASYAEVRRSGADVVLLTSDLDMQHHALSVGIRSLHLAQPGLQPVPKGPIDERLVGRLLHELAVGFGVLELAGLDAWLWGDWAGKTPTDWLAETVRIEGGSALPPMQAFRRDVIAARKVEEALRRP